MTGLERSSRWKVLLRDGSYRWVDVKEFKTHGFGGLNPREVLRALLEHPSYRDDYASPDGETDELIHGPYRVDTISVDAFDPVANSDACRELKVWLEMYGVVRSELIDGSLPEVLQLVESGSAVFRLRDLGKQAHHEWGWVVGQQGFYELVVVGPGDHLRVVVASDD